MDFHHISRFKIGGPNCGKDIDARTLVLHKAKLAAGHIASHDSGQDRRAIFVRFASGELEGVNALRDRTFRVGRKPFRRRNYGECQEPENAKNVTRCGKSRSRDVYGEVDNG